MKNNLPANGSIILKCESLSYNIGYKKILINVSFSIRENNLCLLLGENGSGKSTLLKQIFSHRKNKIAFKPSGKLLNGRIAYLGHDPGIYSTLTLKENISYFSGIYGAESFIEPARELVEIFGLKSRLHDRVSTFSSGMKQKAGIICALSGNPDLILLDEPFSGLDQKSSESLFTIIAEQKRNASMIIVTHDPDFLRPICEFELHLKNGELKT
ncbi:MAG: ABC transporter ATP-binding protein [Leptospira sp.]|nr:ABC transporter ATP-binding protein [Leptospira sp.]